MPTDASAGDPRDSGRRDSPPDGHDDLVFATHDLRRETAQASAGNDLGFAPIERPGEAPADEEVISFTPAGSPPPAAPSAPAAASVPTAPSPPAGPPTPAVAAPPAPPALFAGDAAAPPRPLAPAQGFVIRETQVAPAFPVDALVVGGPAATEGQERERPALAEQPRPFKVSSFTTPDAAQPSAEVPWTVRGAAPGSVPAPAVVRRGWSSRRTGVPESSAAAAILRLREEAVHVSWKSAWIAVTAANPRRARKR
jgi:hypothetical protein